MKRLVISAISVMALLLSAGTAIAADGTTVETIPVSFAPLNHATCSSLPEGTSFTWSGTGKSITRTTTGANGVTTISNTTNVHGFATDQDGKAHFFIYSNTFRVSNTVANPALFSGLMFDIFTLSGRGAARVNAGFVAIFTTDFDPSRDGFEPLTSWGDPITFAPYPQGITPHCDPL